MHPFESAGLGKAPFKFAGYENRVGPIMMADGITQIGTPGQPMGTCDYCGQGIALCMSIRSADGKRFTVGSDCVDKLYRDNNVESSAMERACAQDRVYQEIMVAKLKHQREQRHQREGLTISEGRAFVEQHQALLESVPSSVRVEFIECAERIFADWSMKHLRVQRKFMEKSGVGTFAPQHFDSHELLAMFVNLYEKKSAVVID